MHPARSTVQEGKEGRGSRPRHLHPHEHGSRMGWRGLVLATRRLLPGDTWPAKAVESSPCHMIFWSRPPSMDLEGRLDLALGSSDLAYRLPDRRSLGRRGEGVDTMLIFLRPPQVATAACGGWRRWMRKKWGGGRGTLDRRRWAPLSGTNWATQRVVGGRQPLPPSLFCSHGGLIGVSRHTSPSMLHVVIIYVQTNRPSRWTGPTYYYFSIVFLYFFATKHASHVPVNSWAEQHQ
jgi:hypothetical protein